MLCAEKIKAPCFYQCSVIMHLMTTFVQGHSSVLRTHTELIICKCALLKMFVYCREPGDDLSHCCLKMQTLFLGGSAQTCKIPFSSARKPGFLAQLIVCSDSLVSYHVKTKRLGCAGMTCTTLGLWTQERIQIDS